jgi:hypothetical protein
MRFALMEKGQGALVGEPSAAHMLGQVTVIRIANAPMRLRVRTGSSPKRAPPLQ